MSTTPIPNTLDVSGDLSSFVKKDEFLDGPHRFQISHVERVTFDGKGGQPAQQKIVLTLNGDRKMSLNKTNLKTLVKAWSTNATTWIGRSIEIWLNPDVTMGSETVGGLRVRLVPPPTVKPVRPPAVVPPPPDDDDIAFAMGPNDGDVA
jgi:hypothetical protein